MRAVNMASKTWGRQSGIAYIRSSFIIVSSKAWQDLTKNVEHVEKYAYSTAGCPGCEGTLIHP